MENSLLTTGVGKIGDVNMNANIKARRPKGYKPFWESDQEQNPEPVTSGLYNRIIGNKNAAETATDSVEEMKKKDRFGKLRTILR